MRHIFFATILSVCGLPAQSENVVNLHAVYLDAPTPWCAADVGVPVVVTMDGPDVGGTLASEFFVTQRHGTERVRVRIPPPEGHENLSSVYTGRFSARLEVCDHFWETQQINGKWQVANGASIVDSGNYESGHFGLGSVPLFRRGYGSDDLVFRLPDKRRLIAKGPIEVTKTMEAFASTAKEQSE